MKTQQFEQIVEETLNKIREVLINKAKEYADEENDNRLFNFEDAARMDDTTPENALWGMYLKHLVSVKQMVKNPKKVTPYMIEEKIIDSINYNILLKAIFIKNLENETR